MRTRVMATVLLAVAACGAGCDWRPFDSLQNQVPVLAVEAPSGYPSSNDFGSLLVATRPPADGSGAARFVTSATLQTAVTVVILSPGGGASAHNVSSPVLDQLGGLPVSAVAAIPGTEQALLGAPQSDGGSIFVLDMAVLPAAVTAFPGITPVDAAESLLGVGVAAGNLTGSAGADLVVLSASALHVYVGGGTTEAAATSSSSCPIALFSNVQAHDRIQRGVVVGKLTGSTPVVAVGTPGAGVAGNVSFFAYDGTAKTLSCLFSLTAPGNDVDFGRSLAVGDFNGDGAPDLLVGSPQSHTYLYRGPIAAGAAPVTLTDPAGSSYFGAAATAINLNGAGGDQALISDPSATVNGQQGAGHVLEFTGGALGTTASVLNDHGAGSNEAYGSSVAALPFCAVPPCTSAPVQLPLIGANNKAFVYFTLSGADPRVK